MSAAPDKFTWTLSDVVFDEKPRRFWDEGAHPREPGGSEKGGQFAPKDAGGSSAEKQLPDWAKEILGKGKFAPKPPTQPEPLPQGQKITPELEGASRKWWDSLDADQRALINGYGKTGSGLWNLCQRRNACNEQERANVARIASALDRASLPHDVTVYRTIDSFNGREQMFKVGNIFTDKGFVSTSTEPGTAEHFGGAFVTIKARRGAKGTLLQPGMTPYPEETEILFQHGSRFRITGYRKVDVSPTQFRHHIEAELI